MTAIADKSAVISGASSGIGEALARLVAARGARTVLLGRNEQRLKAAAEAIAGAGGRARPMACDLADADAVAATAGRILRETGAPDILVNNAGAGRWAPFADMSAADIRAAIEVPCLAAAWLTRALLPAMIERGSGRLVFVTSPGSWLAWPNAAAYIAARHAVKGLAEALRAELRGTGVGVTLAVLGSVDTPYWAHNPGSRQYLPAALPWLLPTLSPLQAAQAIVSGIERDRARVVAPAFHRAILALNAVAPGLVQRRMRKAAKRAGAGGGKPAA